MRLAVIGGSGFDEWSELERAQHHQVETPYGDALVMEGELPDGEILFMPRHGAGHRLPPHLINYRANIHALQQLGATHVLAVNAVGGIDDEMAPGRLVVPDQIIDYTYGREHTFFTGDAAGVEHVEFGAPFNEEWRQTLLRLLTTGQHNPIAGAVYGCTQGPRLETHAEVQRLKRDGCDLVGMTAMPEAALARELDLTYAMVAIVVNWAAGLHPAPISFDEIYRLLRGGVTQLKAVLPQLVAAH